MARLRPDQWADIRAAWIGTDKPIRELGREFGVDHKAISKRAAAEVWGDRNASLRKAEKVAAKLAGGVHGVPKVPSEVPSGEDVEVDRDVKVMTLAADVGESILNQCRDRLESPLEPKDLNQTTDAWRKAVDGYRRVRGLDIAATPDKDIPRPFANLTDEELERQIHEGKA
jgi:hypothetical protein